MAKVLQVTMYKDEKFKYKHYIWLNIHSDIKTQCDKIRKQFLLEKSQNKDISRVDVIHQYVINGSLPAIQCIPQEEIAAVLQCFEMDGETEYINYRLVFDATCNLWINISKNEVEEFSNLSNNDQLDYFMMKKTEFIQWYTTKKRVCLNDLEVLKKAVHMPMLHKLSDHSTLDLMICYLFC